METQALEADRFWPYEDELASTPAFDPLRSVVTVRFAAAKRYADAVHSPESGVTKKGDISYASCPVSLASRTKNPLMAPNTIHSAAPLAAGCYS